MEIHKGIRQQRRTSREEVVKGDLRRSWKVQFMLGHVCIQENTLEGTIVNNIVNDVV